MPEADRFRDRPNRQPVGEPRRYRLRSCRSSPTSSNVEASPHATWRGEHLDYSNWLHRIWYPARERAGLEWLQFHDLRRANATGLVHEGVDLKTAQTRLGHTDPHLTLAVYAQATTEAGRAAADALGERSLRRERRDTGRGLA